MYEIFKICFLAGLLLIVIAFFIGQIFDFTGIDGLDLPIGDCPLFLSFSPLLLYLFMTVFGGIGMLLVRYATWMPLIAAIAIAFVVGVLIATLIKRWVIIPLRKAENTSAATEDELIGLTAKVTEKITKQGFGEITYIIYGNTYLAPAKSAAGEEVSVGTEVSIRFIKDHVFYVEKQVGK